MLYTASAITPALYFAWPKQCFCHPWLTVLLPKQPHVSKRRSAATSLSQAGGKCTYQRVWKILQFVYIHTFNLYNAWEVQCRS